MGLKEHFSNGRSLSLGSGIALMGAAFSAQVSAWPHWITIGFGYGVGLVLVICATALITKSYYAPESIREPVIRICALVPVSVKMDDMRWHSQHDGVDAVSAVIMNLPSELTSRGGRADGLAASLQFKSSCDSLYIEKAFWLESLANCVDMSVGSTRYVLVGVINAHEFCTFPNRFERDPRESDGGRNVSYATVPIRMSFTKDLSVKIQVYSVETGRILSTETFLIPQDAEIVNRAKGEKMKVEYEEGPSALKKFEDGMKKLFQAPKPKDSPFKTPAKPKPASKD